MKKVLSAFIAVVMLLAMIPAGAIMAVAEVTENDISVSGDTVTIKTVAGWNEVAANQATYADCTIELGNDINFASLPKPLFTTTTFTGTFDGKTHTIYGDQNSSSRPYLPNTATALIAATINGATIKNVTINAIGVKPNADANAYAIVAAEATGDAVTFENITLQNQCYVQATNLTANKAVGFILGKSTTDVTATGITITGTTTYHGTNGTVVYVGGVVGHMNTSGLSTFSDIKISEGFKISMRGYLGGVVGYSEGAGYFHVDNVYVVGEELKNRANNEGSTTGIGGVIGAKRSTTKAAGDSYIKNAYIDVNMYSGDAYSNCGGIVGTWYKNEDVSSNLTIENCYVGGKYSAAKGGAFVDTVGGIVGRYGSTNSTFTIKNVVVSVARNQTWTTNTSGMTTVTATTADVTTATTKNWVVAIAWGGGIVTNATNLYTTLKDNTSGATVINVADIATLVKTDSNGFITGVADSIGFMGSMYAQVTNAVSNKYIVRFVMPVMDEAVGEVEMKVVVKSKTDGEEIHTYTIACNKYSKLVNTYNSFTINDTAHAGDIVPTDFNAKSLVAGAITDVPTGAGYTFEITATYKVDGIAITSLTYGAEVDTNGALVATQA